MIVYPYILVHMQFKDGDSLQITGIVSPRRWTQTRGSGHTFISDLFKREAEQQNRKFVRIERHPLDCLFSMSNKVSDAGDPAIQDLHYVSRAGASIVDYYRSWDCLEGDFARVKYEDFVTDSENAIHGLASVLDVSISRDDARHLWDQYGFKPLPTVDESHFKGGGTNKRQDQIAPEYFPVLEQAGIREMCVELGYDSPWDPIPDVEKTSPPAPRGGADAEKFKMIKGRLDVPIHGEQCVTIRGNMGARSDVLRNAVLRPEFSALLISGAVLGKNGICMREDGFDQKSVR